MRHGANRRMKTIITSGLLDHKQSKHRTFWRNVITRCSISSGSASSRTTVRICIILDRHTFDIIVFFGLHRIETILHWILGRQIDINKFNTLCIIVLYYCVWVYNFKNLKRKIQPWPMKFFLRSNTYQLLAYKDHAKYKQMNFFQ